MYGYGQPCAYVHIHTHKHTLTHTCGHVHVNTQTRAHKKHLQAGLTKFLRIMQRKSTITTATSALTIPTAEVPR